MMSSGLVLTALPEITMDISGFFILEAHILRSTRGFRSDEEVDELWESVIARVNQAVASALEHESDPDTFLEVKEYKDNFIERLFIKYFSIKTAEKIGIFFIQ